MGGELLHLGVGADVGDGGGEHQHLGRLLPHQVLAPLPELGEGAVEEEGLVRPEPSVWCMECTMASLLPHPHPSQVVHQVPDSCIQIGSKETKFIS